MPDFSFIKSYAEYIIALGVLITAMVSFRKWLWPIIADWVVTKPGVEIKRLAFEAEWMKEHSEIAMFRLSTNLEVVWTNPALHVLLKGGEEQFEGANWLKVIHRDDRDEVKRQWRIAVEDKCPYQNVQRMLVGGRYGVFEVIGDPFIHGGKVLEFMGVVREVGFLE